MALKAKAAQNGRSTEAEVRAILTEAALPENRIRMGTEIWKIGREISLTDEDVDRMVRSGDAQVRSPISFD